MSKFNEESIENLLLETLGSFGYECKNAKEVARKKDEWIVKEIFLDSVMRINFESKSNYDFLSLEQKEYLALEAYKKILTLSDEEDLMSANAKMHTYLTYGITLEAMVNSEQRGINLELLDFENVENNAFLALNQFVFSTKDSVRCDVLVFVNGLPLVLCELKHPLDRNADLHKAYLQIETYKEKAKELFIPNALCIISDGVDSKLGSLNADFTRFLKWQGQGDMLSENTRVVDICEVLKPCVLLDFLRYFITYEQSYIQDTQGYKESKLNKKIAAYHQYYAVNKAIESVKKAMQSSETNKKGGVVWHTQGSGKSLSMVFFCAKALKELNNPTLLLLTDRTDLDNQLFNTFAKSSTLLQTTPLRCESTKDLKEKFTQRKGGIIFSTMQKFRDENERFELLSQRGDIIVIADEAHRTQYGFSARLRSESLAYGYAQNVRDALPNATYIGFSGTPIEKDNANTRNVFGDYIDIYDFQKAVDDGATLPLFYESRLAKLHLSEEGKKLIESFDTDNTQGSLLKLQDIIGAKERLKNIAKDILEHFNARKEKLKGKAMIACSSREIAVDLYNELVELEPSLHSDDYTTGRAKVIITSSASDGAKLSKFHTSKEEQRHIANRANDINDCLEFIIVCDMWLTGFDAPPLHTLYIDKPMKGHTLMQAIARVNRVYKDKPSGLIVDYIGIMAELQKALQFYTQGKSQNFLVDKQKLVEVVYEKHEVLKQMLHGFEYMGYFQADTRGKIDLLSQITDKILSDEELKKRFLDEVVKLVKAYIMVLPNDKIQKLSKEIAFFELLKNRIKKSEYSKAQADNALKQSLIKQVIDKELVSEGMIDILDKSQIKTENISILSNEFLEGMRHYKYPHIALETLRKLLNDELQARLPKELKSKGLYEKLHQILMQYQNKLIDAAKVIEELIELSQELIASDEKKRDSGLSDYEYAFYEALSEFKEVEEIMGVEKLRELSKAVFFTIKENATLDWTLRESVRAELRLAVKKVLKKYGYPPNSIQLGVDNAIKQAELIAQELTQERKA
ncbi:type I restriction endonuclease subunit R [Helicobacter winghamensis]|uniref:type I restriction endonuclease subunit R n=1 Tax=Helicobacter winghamensis TaxID=157268 RepID=UPI0018A3D624|nr:type I restriction endonuclease subunit R [Helicobacter winghamensis]QOQ97601.1 type I restriction endonuclease subunit R [Helicobacter winghamensis]